MKQVDKVPSFNHFAYPILDFLSNKKKQSNKDIQKHLISFFNLSDKAVESLTGGGNRTVLYSNTYWALYYMERANLITSKSEGRSNVYSITAFGKDFLKEKGNTITLGSLKGIPDFDKFQHKDESTTTTDEDLSKSSQSDDDFTEKTPEENIVDAINLINSELKGRLLATIREHSWQYFEKLVVDLLVKMGYANNNGWAKNTRFVKDEGIDGIIYQDKLGFSRIYVQAKHYSESNVIGKDVVKNFIHAISDKAGKQGVLITTSRFSKDAIDLALNNKQQVKLELIDGDKLCDYMLEFNLGVYVKETHIVQEIDSSYFDADTYI